MLEIKKKMLLSAAEGICRRDLIGMFVNKDGNVECVYDEVKSVSPNAFTAVSNRFKEILEFHTFEGATILDPTCGYGLWWKAIDRTRYNITLSDKYDFGQNIISDFRNLDMYKSFDMVVFDPPYMFGCIKSDDPLKDVYQGYSQSYDELIGYARGANINFSKLLKENGKLIYKCSDQYNVLERKFYPHHITIVNEMSNFELIDIVLFIYHRVSPTAYQVKNRPSSIINYTYFLIFKVREKEA